ncbi:VOC family protein [Streptomyces sp. NPDC048290]|uniref:VOC family protein n=1 Tax=Streptomyces sp. NPDC048290 TaxID=3155811 RepID=UPI00344AD4A2
MAENSESADREYPEGVPCWVDAQLPDVAAGRRFYGALFGWSFEERADGSGLWARLDGEPVAGLARKADGRLPTVWTVYFATPDVTALGRRVRDAGGQLVSAPLSAGRLGTGALVADPEGAVFGLWQAGSHQGFGGPPAPGTFAWVELYARDTEAANAFYGGLFTDALFGEDAAPAFGRAPVTEVFAAGMPPHFLVHFRVPDCAAGLERVTRLGGRVQAEPFVTSYGTVGVVSDDQGASFALLERAPEGAGEGL